MITENKQAIIDAVAADLGKPASETLLMEIDLVLSEANFVRRRMRWWSARHPKPMHWLLQPAVGWTINEPKGVVLVISPWNYPLLLSLEPMVDAIAAGNAVCLKPSELSPHISHLTAELIERYMDTSAIAVVEGGPEETTDLLAEPFDHIFYTGGGRVGRIVMKAASENLTPVTLELGGKSPCFVDGTVSLAAAARRIAWGKFTNAGQTCVAPDYVLATPDVAQVLAERIALAVTEFYGEDPQASHSFARIINERHFERLSRLLPQEGDADDPAGQIVCGGQTDRVDRYIPLAAYVFSRNPKTRGVFERDVNAGAIGYSLPLGHLISSRLPFGGTGESGMGAYHGKEGFRIFSHKKTVISKPLFPDTLQFIYPPFNDLRQKLIAIIGKLV